MGQDIHIYMLVVRGKQGKANALDSVAEHSVDKDTGWLCFPCAP